MSYQGKYHHLSFLPPGKALNFIENSSREKRKVCFSNFFRILLELQFVEKELKSIQFLQFVTSMNISFSVRTRLRCKLTMVPMN